MKIESPRPVQLTVLTDPMPFGAHRLSEGIKHVARSVRDRFKPPPPFTRSSYRGHFAVTRSLVEGLSKIGASFNYNPKRLAEVAEVVIVLSGVAALRQAISLKRCGVIKKILAGPNILTFPSDHGGVICAPEVDVCITPGPLTCDIYTEDCPELAGRCASWPAGVDTDFWTPLGRERKKLVLIFEKPLQGPMDSIGKYVDWIERKGYATRVITYGRYTKGEFLEALRESSLLVGFTAAESQGITWAEAWSVDVPTFMWHKDRHTYDHPRSAGRTFRSSPAPYLSEETGRFFKTWEEFTETFTSWDAGDVMLSPRAWTLAHMSDEICARHLLEIAGLGQKVRG